MCIPSGELLATVVKRCPLCDRAFSLAEVLESPNIRAIGMSFEEGDFAHNSYFFNHCCPGCGTTFTIPVESFLSLIGEPIPQQVLAGTAKCGGQCRRLKDLRGCARPCYYAPFRRFLLQRLLKEAAEGEGARTF